MKTRWINSVIEASKADDIKLPFGRARNCSGRDATESEGEARARRAA